MCMTKKDFLPLAVFFLLTFCVSCESTRVSSKNSSANPKTSAKRLTLIRDDSKKIKEGKVYYFIKNFEPETLSEREHPFTLYFSRDWDRDDFEEDDQVTIYLVMDVDDFSVITFANRANSTEFDRDDIDGNYGDYNVFELGYFDRRAFDDMIREKSMYFYIDDEEFKMNEEDMYLLRKAFALLDVYRLTGIVEFARNPSVYLEK